MKLAVEERILVFSLLPGEHNYETLKDCIQLRKDVAFNEEEIRKYDIFSGFYTVVRCNRCAVEFDNASGIIPSALDGLYECPKCKKSDKTEIVKEDKGRSQVIYNKQVAEGYTKDVRIKPHAKSYLAQFLSDKSKDKKLTEQFLPLYEKFVV